MSDTMMAISGNGVAPYTDIAPEDDIQITVLPAKANIVIDMSKLTWGDQLALQKYQGRDDIPEDEAARLLNELIEKVTGQDPMKLPGKAVERVIDALFKNGGDGKNQKNSITGSS